jgi:hypothetical protein
MRKDKVALVTGSKSGIGPGSRAVTGIALSVDGGWSAQ